MRDGGEAERAGSCRLAKTKTDSSDPRGGSPRADGGREGEAAGPPHQNEAAAAGVFQILGSILESRSQLKDCQIFGQIPRN